MAGFSFKLLIFILFVQSFTALSCAAGEKINSNTEIAAPSGRYTVYIINNRIHTGIVIPLESESVRVISALKYFKDFQYADFGWGEETAYQDTEEVYWHDVKAVLFPNPSVICVEGYRNISDSFIKWSDFTVMLTLSDGQYDRLVRFIENSFKKDPGNGLIITSERYSGETVFFKSVYRYHLFNTCNTWVAKALQSSGLDISPFAVITAGQLYDKIIKHGKVIKPLK